MNRTLVLDNTDATAEITAPTEIFVTDDVSILGSTSDENFQSYQIWLRFPNQTEFIPLFPQPIETPRSNEELALWRTAEKREDGSSKYPDGEYTISFEGVNNYVLIAFMRFFFWLRHEIRKKFLQV